MAKRYEVSITIVELDEDGELNEEGYEGDLVFELMTDEPPVSVLLHDLTQLPGTSEFCT